jgi:ADP-ribosylglycohydrolase
MIRVDDPEMLGAELAAITHGHPSGYVSAAVLAGAISRIVSGAEIADAVESALGVVSKSFHGHKDTVSKVREGLELGLSLGHNLSPEGIEVLGDGWEGHEALAIAVAAAVSTHGVHEALAIAVTHSGDSDSTGSIAGNLLGARYGVGQLPNGLVRGVEGYETILELSHALHAVYW